MLKHLVNYTLHTAIDGKKTKVDMLEGQPPRAPQGSRGEDFRVPSTAILTLRTINQEPWRWSACARSQQPAIT